MPSPSTKVIAAEHELGHALLSLICAIGAAAFSVPESLSWILALVGAHQQGNVDELRKRLEAFLRQYSGQPHTENMVDHAHLTRQKIKALIGIRRSL